MLLRHSAIYFLARGMPGLVGFATIIIFTRILTPQAYGEYTLIVTGAVLCNAILYQWINASLLRFLPNYRGKEEQLLATILGGYLIVSLIPIVGGSVFAIGWWKTTWGGLTVIGVFLTCAQAWFTINLELARSRLSPMRYGVISLIKSIFALGVGITLILLGYGALGALLGLVLGFSVASIFASWREWPLPRRRHWDWVLSKDLLAYGLPLTASFALGTVISSSDRFMLVWLIDESATGLFAAGQGLVQQAIIALMTIVHLAAYPLILRTMERKGVTAAQKELQKNAMLLFGIGIPAAIGFIVLSPSVARIFLGAAFQSAAIGLMPWFAFTTFIWCARAYHFDLAFYLGKRTRSLVLIMSLAAVANVILNLIWIPKYGLIGAAYASAAGHGIAILLSVLIGRRVFELPAIVPDLVKLATASLVMIIPLLVVPDGDSLSMLLLSVVLAFWTYVTTLYLFNFGDVRPFVDGLSQWLHRAMRKSANKQ